MIKTKNGHDLLIRIDERTKNLEKTMQEIKNSMDEHYITKHEFKPVKMTVYGLVSTVLVAVLVSILKMVV